jgi:hypothetical protein
MTPGFFTFCCAVSEKAFSPGPDAIRDLGEGLLHLHTQYAEERHGGSIGSEIGWSRNSAKFRFFLKQQQL